jgi:hypothetical protein
MAYRFFIASGLLAMAATCRAAIATEPVPVLQLAGNDFPELVLHRPAEDENGDRLPLACDQIRGRRIDELDPLWKQAIERIHVDCEDLTEEQDGFDMVATVVTGFLRPGSAQFAGVPVAEVRLMDSELWGDHEYILDRPYAEIRETLKGFIESRCRAPREDPQALLGDTCKLTETEQGIYLEADSVGGIWLHPLQEDPLRTVYAEAWSD